jgi:hypothetical protein
VRRCEWVRAPDHNRELLKCVVVTCRVGARVEDGAQDPRFSYVVVGRRTRDEVAETGWVDGFWRGGEDEVEDCD